MKHIVQKPDGTEARFLSRDDFVIAYNNHEIEAGWPGKTEGAVEWSRVWQLLGIPAPTGSEATAPACPANANSLVGGRPTSSRPAGTAQYYEAAAARYRDAYRVAAATVTIGLVLKIVALCLAGLCLLAAVAGASHSIANLATPTATPFLAGLIAGVGVGIPFYALGILVSAIGQVLKATLDTAVHTSPFLDKNQMAQIMVRH